MSLLSLDSVHIRFGNDHAVQGVSLTVEKGETVAIVGESGSGKSLTALSILKLLPSEAQLTGTVTFDGTVLSTQPNKAIARFRGRRIGMIFQEPMTALNPLHPIRKQIIESYAWHHKINWKSAKAQQKINVLLETVGLTHLAPRGTLYPHQLSGGERQRVMIAMAIACDPDLLVADEPTTALDVTLQSQILDLLKKLQAERGMGMIFITHDLLTVRRIADRVIVMHRGHKVEEGKTAEIFHNPQHHYTKMLLSAAPAGSAIPIDANAPEILCAEKLCVHFPVKTGLFRRQTGVIRAVNDVSLTLHAGETVGIVGESGSGKSSLGYALLRLIDSTGPIVFLGQRIDAFRPRQMMPLRHAMQLVFQDPYSSLNPRMTVGEIVAEGLRLHAPKLSRLEIDRQVEAMLEQVGLAPGMKHRYPHAFSGGQRQRIAIARAMILKPRLVVLDEPTSALDMSVQAQMLTLLGRLQQSHAVAYVFISHDLRTVRAMAHQVVIMQKGQVVEQGATQAIFENPQTSYTKTLMQAAFDAS